MRATREMSKRYQRSFANGENGGNITTGMQLGKVDSKGNFQKLDMFMKDLQHMNLDWVGTLVLQGVINSS